MCASLVDRDALCEVTALFEGDGRGELGFPERPEVYQ